MGRIHSHVTVDDKRGHHFDIYDFEVQSDPDEIGTEDADRLPTIQTAAVLGTSSQTLPTLTLFYQGTGIRLSGQSSGRFSIVARRDLGSAGAGSSVPPVRKDSD